MFSEYIKYSKFNTAGRRFSVNPILQRKCIHGLAVFIFGVNMPKTVDKIIKICPVCNNKFLVYPSLSRQVTCSRKCNGVIHSKRMSGENNSSWIPRVDKVCKFCGKDFKVEQWEIRNGFGKFCSHQCMFDSRKIRINIKCPNCKKIFSAQKFKLKYKKTHMFCSLKCYREYTKGSVILICKNCGKEYETRKSQIKHRGSSCCSKQCHWEHNRGKNNPNWKGGIEFWKKRDTSSDKHIKWRKAVFIRDNWTCQICGARSKAKSLIIIHPHHIKSYAKYPKLRYKVDNGKTLCIDCHKELHKKLRNANYADKKINRKEAAVYEQFLQELQTELPFTNREV